MQLESFLRHVESLSSAPPATVEQCDGDDCVVAPPTIGDGAAAVEAGTWASVLNGGGASTPLSAPEESADGIATLRAALSALQARPDSVPGWADWARAARQHERTHTGLVLRPADWSPLR